jgi:hypothetical protein
MMSADNADLEQREAIATTSSIWVSPHTTTRHCLALVLKRGEHEQMRVGQLV